MKRKLILRIVSCLTAVIIFLCAGCGTATPSPSSAPEGSVTLDELSSYAIVCPEDCDPYLTFAIEAFQDKLESITGTRPQIVSSSDFSGSSPALLVGTGSEEQLALLPELFYYDCAIRIQDKNIIISGGSVEATIDAVNYLTQECINWLHPEISFASLEYTNQQDYPLDSITIDGKDISEFTITRRNATISNTVIKNCIRHIASLCGKPIEFAEEAGENNIYLSIDNTMAPRNYEVTYEDGTLNIKGADQYALLSGCREVFTSDVNQILPAISTTGSYPEGEDVLYMFEYTDLETPQIYIYGTTVDNAVDYAVGEEIDFMAFCVQDGVALKDITYNYWTMYDGQSDYPDSVRTHAEDGILRLTNTLEEPGAVVYEVEVLDQYGSVIESIPKYYGGAIANREEIQAVHSEPEDFDAFWAAQLAKLDEIAPEATIVKDKSDDEYYIYDIQIATIGDPACGYISYPKNAEPGSLDIEMNYQPYGVNGTTYTTSPTAIIFNVGAHSIPNDMPASYYEELHAGALALFALNDGDDPENCYFYFMIMRDLQALRYAKSLPQWNGEHISVSGGSMGGFQSTCIAALDNDVDTINLSIPWMCDVFREEGNRIPATFMPEAKEGLDYYDTTFMAKRVSSDCYAYIQAGLADRLCPTAGVAALFNNLPCYYKEITWVQDHLHSPTQPVHATYTLRMRDGNYLIS